MLFSFLHFEHLHSPEFSAIHWQQLNKYFHDTYVVVQMNNFLGEITWMIAVFGLANRALPVGDIARDCWRSTWFSDSKLESFSSSLDQR